MVRNIEQETSRLDDAARAGWLYYIAGNTQDEIARKLGVSRQTAQRLVSLSISEKLIKVRLDHPIANCLELAERVLGALRCHEWNGSRDGPVGPGAFPKPNGWLFQPASDRREAA